MQQTIIILHRNNNNHHHLMSLSGSNDQQKWMKTYFNNKKILHRVEENTKKKLNIGIPRHTSLKVFCSKLTQNWIRTKNDDDARTKFIIIKLNELEEWTNIRLSNYTVAALPQTNGWTSEGPVVPDVIHPNPDIAITLAHTHTQVPEGLSLGLTSPLSVAKTGIFHAKYVFFFFILIL